MKILPVFIIFIFLGLSSTYAQTLPSSWADVQKYGSGDIVFYYRDTEPFIIQDDEGNLSGIEYDLVKDFTKFIDQNYGLTVNVSWERKDRFSLVYNAIRSEKKNGTFGISIISNTDQRQKEVKFSPSYMPDISVMISSENIEVVNSIQDYNKVFEGLSAVTILATTYEHQLNTIRNKYINNFPIIYVENTDNVLETIANNDDFFGYVDLPNYLIALDKHMKIKRQNIFPFKHLGYGLIYPLNSDWDVPVRAYFNNPDFDDFIHKTIEQYLGKDVFDFMEVIAHSENESLMLLAREKEIQDRELSRNELVLREQRAIRNLFIVGFLATVLVLIMLFNRYRVKVKANEVLKIHRSKIENQRKNIKTQNDQLELRNSELIALNDERNNLVNILSHDLRAPANNIQGLVSIFKMENKELPENQNKIINHIKSEATRLNLMIEKILDIRSLEAKKINIKLEKINITKVTKGIVKSFEEQANAKNIVINFVENEKKIFINADEIYLKQIIENLISNALKFSFKRTLITIHLNKDIYDKVKLEITDEGPGIAPEDIKKMFRKFQRLSAKPTGGEHSTGLGLSIVEKFVREMNGKVWCKSELKKGTTFIVEFDAYHKETQG